MGKLTIYGDKTYELCFDLELAMAGDIFEYILREVYMMYTYIMYTTELSGPLE